MLRLDEVVDQYLRMATNYALMITGDWGAGKTHYFKHKLKDKISKTPVFQDQTKNYRPILVSLFGLKSVEEIQAEIFLCLYPLLKNPKIKLTANIGKAVIKGALLLKGLDKFSTFVDVFDNVEKSVNKNAFINIEELVICFDDLERINPNLRIEEIIGYINSLVESENVKVLIIANQGKGALTQKTFKKFQEKVIGNTIEFIQSFGESYDSILKSRFIGFKQYKEFLETNKDFVLEVFFNRTSNLRILIFSLSYFQYIYSEVKLQLANEDGLKEKQDEILLNLLKFTIAISIEYKEAKITFKERKKLDETNRFDWGALLLNTEPVNNKDKEIGNGEFAYRESFLEKYYTNDKYNFYRSVYDYVTGGTSFNYSILKEELVKIYHIEGKVSLPQYEIYNKLCYQDCFSLGNDEYLKLTKQMLKYAYKGAYDIKMYVSIFFFATRFGNPLKLNLDTLERAIIKGMMKGKSNYKYYHSIEFHIGASSYTENKDNIDRISKVACDLNNVIFNEKKTHESSQLQKLCYENFAEFSDKVLDRQQSFYFEPIFLKFNANKFYTFLINSNHKKRWEFVSFFRDRYSESPSSELEPDIPFLQKLLTKVKKKSNRLSGKNISGFVYNELLKHLENAINRLNTIRN